MKRSWRLRTGLDREKKSSVEKDRQIAELQAKVEELEKELEELLK